MLGLLLIACLLLQAANSRHPDEPMYLVTVTSQTTGGSTETICGHILLQKGPLSFMLALETGGSKITLLEELVTTEFHRCVQFQVPPVVTDTVAAIHASIKGEKTSLSKKTKILIKPSYSLTIIQTDKPIYKPGQTIKIRIVSLDYSFLPYKEVYQTVELQDPNSKRIAQWLNQSITTGILDLSHPTTPKAKQGVYTISARTKKGIISTQTFEIIEYVLSKFEVKVHLPDVIFAHERQATVNICGKYTYGKPVLGSVEVHMCYWLGWGQFCKRQVTMRTDKTGCATHLFDVYSSHIEEYLIVSCAMEEDGTGVVLKGSGSTKILSINILDKIDIEFQDTSSTFKPGINYDGKIIVKVAGSSIANKTIFLSSLSEPHTTKWTLTTDSEGVASFSLNTSSWLAEYAQLEAHCDGVFAHHTADKFYSKNKSFLSIKQVKEPLPCDKDGQVLARYIIQGEELKEKKTLNFFYLVLSKGRMVQHGRSEVMLNEGEVKRGELSFSLQQTEYLAPYAQVVVYTMLPNAEVMADSLDFPIQLCFKNKVSLQFSSSQELPGGKAFLEVQAQPGSLCSLRAIDQSVLLMRPDKELSAQKVYGKLPVDRLSGYPNDLQDWEQPPCLFHSKSTSEQSSTTSTSERSWIYLPPQWIHGDNDDNGKTDLYGIFEAVGVKALTNSDLKKPVPCTFGGDNMIIDDSRILRPPPPPPPKETIRTSFPETWIWELVPVG
ncbi:hypothetical protein SKAU_G00429840 [Synaphobranchus kaupii]|uniref:Alpha-2-macroglobulin bait region domain-containing protein n=1 Tax=Synaphobranchus kaupii TaxID=118154 RepID=A0A9Q1E4B7_SYNKA|nr:hypothetical protein SKAU_G00429840 [Synaphobranchus kaupii]